MLERNQWLPRYSTTAWRVVMRMRKSRLVAGAFAVNSRLQPDGADHITPRPQVVYLDPMFPHKQKARW